jgi:hypothetical protein
MNFALCFSNPTMLILAAAARLSDPAAGKAMTTATPFPIDAQLLFRLRKTGLAALAK